MAEVREGLLYTEGNMWIRRMDDGEVCIGITDHGQSDLGDVVYVDVPKEGREVRKGDEFGAMESVKTVEPIYAPVSGTVIRSNTDLSDSPETINESPYDNGWITIIRITDESELSSMMDHDAYSESTK